MRTLMAPLVMLAMLVSSAPAGAADAPANHIVVVATVAQWPGKIFVNHDAQPLSELAFAIAPDDARNLALNIAAWFTGGRPGKFLVYSWSGYLRGASLAAAMRGAGHSWTASTTVPLTLETLRGYDAVFLLDTFAGDPAVLSVLTDYVRSGGHVYLAGGGFTPAAMWNSFLNAFGLGFHTEHNDLYNMVVPVSSPSPLLAGVTRMYTSIGHNVEVLDPGNTATRILYSYAGNNLFATYDTGTLTVPIDLRAETCPNRLHVGSREVIRVVIFGTPSLDVTSIDHASVRILGVAPLQSYGLDAGSPGGPPIGKTSVVACSRPERDKLQDLVLTFDGDQIVRAIESRLGRSVRNDEVLAITLSGHLKPEAGGLAIVGEDLAVVHVPPGKSGPARAR